MKPALRRGLLIFSVFKANFRIWTHPKVSRFYTLSKIKLKETYIYFVMMVVYQAPKGLTVKFAEYRNYLKYLINKEMFRF